MKSAFVLIGFIIAGAVASAETIYDSACPTSDLGTYITNFGQPNGAGCDTTSSDYPADSVGYYGFYFSASQTGSDTLLQASDISVTPDGAFGFVFTGLDGGTISSGNVVTYTIGFNIDPPPVLGGDSLTLDPPNNVTADVYYCQNNQDFAAYYDNVLGCTDPASPDSEPSPLTFLDEANAANGYSFDDPFAGGPYSIVGIEIVIALNGPSASLPNMETVPDIAAEDPTPEPASIGLTGAALIGLAVLKFRRWQIKRP